MLIVTRLFSYVIVFTENTAINKSIFHTYLFLVGAFLVKIARQLQWLIFLVGAFPVTSARLLHWLVVNPSIF